MTGQGAMDELGVASQLRFLGPCRIEGELYDLGPYPAMKKSGGEIVGELFEILDARALEVLDRFEGYEPERPEDSLYLRERTRLIAPHAVEAWVYVYRNALDPALSVGSGDWRAHTMSRG